MPNWVLNSVKVEGDKKQIKDLFEMFKDGVDFEKIDKMPEEIKNTTSPNRDAESRIEMKQKYGAEDWYDWACQHWGTKWNVIPKETLINSELQTMEFNTAWATPIEFFQSLSKRLTENVVFPEPGVPTISICFARSLSENPIVSPLDDARSFPT